MLSAFLALSACANEPDIFRMNVVLSNADESEVFFGETAGTPNNQGGFILVSRDGVRCDGVYILSSPEEGEAITRCDDGRTGAFDIRSVGQAAVVSGRIGGEYFEGGAVDRRIVQAAMAEVRS